MPSLFLLLENILFFRVALFGCNFLHVNLLPFQFRQPLNNLHGLHTNVDDAQEQVEDVAGVVDLF